MSSHARRPGGQRWRPEGRAALQSVHDGTRFVHEPVRLNVFIAAPTEAIDGVIDRHRGWLTSSATVGFISSRWPTTVMSCAMPARASGCRSRDRDDRSRGGAWSDGTVAGVPVARTCNACDDPRRFGGGCRRRSHRPTTNPPAPRPGSPVRPARPDAPGGAPQCPPVPPLPPPRVVLMTVPTVLEEKGRCRCAPSPSRRRWGRATSGSPIHTVGICGIRRALLHARAIGPFVVREPMILGHEASAP